MSQASDLWMGIYNGGRIHDPDIFPEFTWLPSWVPGPRMMQKNFDDGSMLRWSDRQNKWMFFNSQKELEDAQWRGDIEGWRFPGPGP